MASISELHKAIIKGQIALVKELANSLKQSGVDISGEIAFANKLCKINPGNAIKKIVEVLQ